MLYLLIKNIDNILLRLYKENDTPFSKKALHLIYNKDITEKISIALLLLNLNEYQLTLLATDIEEEMFNAFKMAWSEKCCTVPPKNLFIKILTGKRDKLAITKYILKQFYYDTYNIKSIIKRMTNELIKPYTPTIEMREMLRQANKIYNTQLNKINDII